MPAFKLRANKIYPTWFTDETIYVTFAYGQSRASDRAEGNGIVLNTTAYVRNNTRIFMMDNARAPGHALEADFNLTDANNLVPFYDGRGNNSSGGATANSPLGQSLGSSLVYLDMLEEAAGDAQKRRSYISAGEGGRLISEISKGADPWVGSGGTFVIYDRLIKMLTRTQSLAASRGFATKVECIYFLQGEADANNGVMTPKAVYTAARNQLFADMRADVVTLTGQTEPVEILTDITACTAIGGVGRGVGSDVIIAQVEMAIANADSHTWCVGPGYYLPFFATQHMTKEGVVMLAEMFAHARHQLQQGATPNFLYATDFSLVGNTITITCNVPEPPLLIDETTVPAATGTNSGGAVLVDGFELTDGSSRTITSITCGTNTITLTLSGTPSGTVRLRYAMNGMGNTAYTDTNTGRTDVMTPGSWGNIRDSRDTASYFVSGGHIRNFLCPFDHTF